MSQEKSKGSKSIVKSGQSLSNTKKSSLVQKLTEKKTGQRFKALEQQRKWNEDASARNPANPRNLNSSLNPLNINNQNNPANPIGRLNPNNNPLNKRRG